MATSRRHFEVKPAMAESTRKNFALRECALRQPCSAKPCSIIGVKP